MKQVWEETAQLLREVYDRRESENISYLLLEDVFQVSKSDVLMNKQLQIDLEKLGDCRERLLSHEPLQYVTGLTYFFGRKFQIQKGALIPRPETEELVQLIIDENGIEKPKILDIGVGSGCIAISLAMELKSEIFGTDVSADALEIAKKNSTALDANVSFANHDILTSDLDVNNLDILVSNPPYIPKREGALMSKNVLAFEPEVALFVMDDDPIVFYKRIAEKGLKSLKKGGKLYFEIHEQFGDAVEEYLVQLGYVNVKIHKDMQGKERMIRATNF